MKKILIFLFLIIPSAAVSQTGSSDMKSPGNNNSIQTDSVYHSASVQVPPLFPGGEVGWSRFVGLNIRFPRVEGKEKLVGRVMLQFIIEKDGGISEVKVLKGVGQEFDDEAVRLIKSSPNWKPGYQDGQPVRVSYYMPITFRRG